MKELDDMAATFGVSEPVFTISVHSGSGDLQFDVKNEYRPAESMDPVYNLMAGTYSERLAKEQRRFEANVDTNMVYDRIVDTIRRVVVNASPLKNPRQSKLYKWLCERDPMYNNPSTVGFIALYRYIIAEHLQDAVDSENPHAKNVLAVLELMREKYEVKSSSN